MVGDLLLNGQLTVAGHAPGPCPVGHICPAPFSESQSGLQAGCTTAPGSVGLGVDSEVPWRGVSRPGD